MWISGCIVCRLDCRHMILGLPIVQFTGLSSDQPLTRCGDTSEFRALRCIACRRESSLSLSRY